MSNSFARRLLVAAALLVGFYAFALAVALGAFALVVVQWATPAPENIWISLACVVTGGLILKSIVPRRQRFEPPGPLLDADGQPRLHALVGEVAEAVGEPPPAAIYLAPDVNAGVAQLGGLLGLGGRRVLFVGLPLLDTLTVDELRAVLAHEYGHYHASDTRLGRWFFRTWDALERTIVALHEYESIWRRPFAWYGEFFLRRTAAIKRQQEFLADGIAARVASRAAAIESLRKVACAAPAFDAFLEAELAPAIDARYRPPMIQGFQAFKRSAPVQEGMRRALDEASAIEGDRYDTHPTLAERIEALERAPAGSPRSGDDDVPALSLLNEVDALETELLVALIGPDLAVSLRPLRWDEFADAVVIPGWTAAVDEHAHVLGTMSVEDLPAGAGEVQRLAARLLPADVLPPEIAIQRDYVIGVSAAALGLALRRAGWEVHAAPGEPVVCTRGDRRLEPAEPPRLLAFGDLEAETWRARCRALGIEGLALAERRTAAAEAPTPA